MTRDLALDLIEHHVPEFRTAVEPHLLPSLRIRTQRLAYDGSGLPTKFGGQPLMPPELAWPMWDARPWHAAQIRHFEQVNQQRGPSSETFDRILADLRAAMQVESTPLAFIGQIQVDELPMLPLDGLPRHGRLLFFYDLRTDPGSYDPASIRSGRVLYVPDTTRDVIRTPPLPTEYASFPHTATMSFDVEWTLPDDLEDEGIPLRRWGDDDRYSDLLDDLAGEAGPLHRIGGHSQPVQNDMRLEAQLVTNGIWCGDSSGYNDPRAAVLAPGVNDWQLLLQIDTDDDGIGWMWGDSGMFYVWIRRQDLLAGTFDHVWCSVQCC